MDRSLLLEKAASLLSLAKQHLLENEWSSARDFCLQISALLEGAVLMSEGFPVQQLDIDDRTACSTMHTENSHYLQIGREMLLNISIALATHGVLNKTVHSNTTSFPVVPVAENFETTFDSIVGCADAKCALFENIVLPFNCSECVKATVFTGIRSGCGNVLLHGPPGTGKTLLAQAVAAAAHASLFTLNPSDVLSKYQGESERYVKAAFDAARLMGKAIIFFDEFDSIALTRGHSDDNAQQRRLLSELLLQMTHNKQMMQRRSQHTDSLPLVVVIAATNRLEDLDEAMIRRFDAKIFVGLPEIASRADLVKKFMRGISWDCTAEEMAHIAEATNGWSGSDIELLCREAAMTPVREILMCSKGEKIGKRTRETRDSVAEHPFDSIAWNENIRAVNFHDFVNARNRLLPEAVNCLGEAEGDNMSRESKKSK